MQSQANNIHQDKIIKNYFSFNVIPQILNINHFVRIFSALYWCGKHLHIQWYYFKNPSRLLISPI